MNSATWAWVCAKDGRLPRVPDRPDPEPVEDHMARWQRLVSTWAAKHLPRTLPAPALPMTADERTDRHMTIWALTDTAALALERAKQIAQDAQLSDLAARLGNVAADVEQIRDQTELSGA